MRDDRVRAPMLSVGSARANSSRQQAGESRISLILDRRAGTDAQFYHCLSDKHYA